MLYEYRSLINKIIMIKKNTIVGVRCSTEERNEMKRKAHEQYKTLSEYIRDLALKNE